MSVFVCTSCGDRFDKKVKCTHCNESEVVEVIDGK